MKSILLFSLSLITTNLFSQSKWTSIADFGGNARVAAVGFSINGKAYVGSGFPSGYPEQKDFFMYDPSTNAWTQVADYAGTAFSYGFATSVNGMGYAGLGGNTDWYQYNPITNVWTEKASWPESFAQQTAGFSIGDNIYVGTNSSAEKKCWMYDTQNDTWIGKADFGGDARRGAVGFAINGKGYIGLGFGPGSDGYECKADFWEYDPSTNAWTRKADYPNGGKYSGVGFAIGNKGYCGMGFDNDFLITDDFYEFDPVANTWLANANYPINQFDAAYFVIGNEGYCGTGGGADETNITTFYKFTPANVVTSVVSLHQQSLKIYPNPSVANVWIESNNSSDVFNSGTFQLFNSSGAKVLQLQAENNISIQKISLDMLPLGMYDLIFTDDASGAILFNEKIVKQ